MTRAPSPVEMKVLQSLVKHCGYGVMPPQKIIAHDIGCNSRGSVTRALSRLRSLGLVENIMCCWRPTRAGLDLCGSLDAHLIAASEKFSLPITEIISPRRTATAARARAFVVLLASRSGIPDVAIARGLGGRHVSTISYARKRAIELETRT